MAVQLVLSTPDCSNVNLFTVDEDMCKHFGVDVHPSNWYGNWMNTVGFTLACGHDYDKALEFYPDSAEIIEYMRGLYTNNSHYTR